jgi:hypothetical protein
MDLSVEAAVGQLWSADLWAHLAHALLSLPEMAELDSHYLLVRYWC